ncbi:MAG: complex I NDUFA9 subunit family protein [candidate division Zixibacteria bacterium]|nr:complex I NDUFA9 subunit family protein [candidate division Zixibacteria bacterium]
MNEGNIDKASVPDELQAIAVLGGSGFIGSYLVLNLLQMGCRFNLLVNRTDPDLVSPTGRIKTFQGSIENETALEECFTGCEVVYHLVGLIAETRTKTFQKTVVEGTGHVVAAARKAGVKKIIYLSALGADPDARSAYYRTKFQAERQVVASGLDYTIFRPSIVYGLQDKFINMLAGMIRRSPVTPVVGDGQYRLQPVYVEELCAVMARSAREGFTSGRIYEIGGAEPLTYLEILDIIKRILKKKRVTVHIPVFMARWGARVLELFMKPAPLTVDQIAMLAGGSTCDQTIAERDFGVKFSPLENQLQKYLGK